MVGLLVPTCPTSDIPELLPVPDIEVKWVENPVCGAHYYLWYQVQPPDTLISRTLLTRKWLGCFLTWHCCFLSSFPQLVQTHRRILNASCWCLFLLVLAWTTCTTLPMICGRRKHWLTVCDVSFRSITRLLPGPECQLLFPGGSICLGFHVC